MSSDATTSASTTEDPRRLRRAFTVVLAFVCLLWALKLVEALAGVSFARFGVFPQRLDGLGGVLWAPLIHGSWSHLFANTAPVLVLGTALLYGYPRSARIVLPAVYLGAGLAVWLFARPSFHIGASGLTFGVLLFVFTIGVLRWDRQAIALAMIVFFLYGSMIWGILPYDSSVSYETHLSGAVIGIVLAFALRWLDPPRPRPRYSWEDEEQEDDTMEAQPDEPPHDHTLHRAGRSVPTAAPMMPAPGVAA
jgi:membrane associated rhomboid family serine protease